MCCPALAPCDTEGSPPLRSSTRKAGASAITEVHHAVDSWLRALRRHRARRLYTQWQATLQQKYSQKGSKRGTWLRSFSSLKGFDVHPTLVQAAMPTAWDISGAQGASPWTDVTAANNRTLLTAHSNMFSDGGLIQGGRAPQLAGSVSARWLVAVRLHRTGDASGGQGSAALVEVAVLVVEPSPQRGAASPHRQAHLLVNNELASHVSWQ